MKFMKVSMYVFIGVLAYFTLIGLMQAFGWSYPSTGLVVTTIVLFVFAGINILGMFGQKFRLKKIGFYLLHAGIVLFLLGCFIYDVGGKSGNVWLDVNRTSSTIQLVDGDSTRNYNLGFSVGFTRMQIATAPYYIVFDKNGKQVSDSIYARGDGDAAVFDFGKFDKTVTVGECRVGSTLKMLTFTGKYEGYYANASSSVTHYEADFLIKDGGETVRRVIEVNKPVRYRGWKIYLMNAPSTSEAMFLVKKDPGEPVSIVGIVFMITGAFYACILQGFVDRKSPEPMDAPSPERDFRKADRKRDDRARSGGKGGGR